MLLKDTPAVLYSENSATINGFTAIRPVVRNHIKSKMAGRWSATQRSTIRCLWSVDKLFKLSSPPASPTSLWQEAVTLTERPASMRSESMSEKIRGNLSHGPPETEKPNKIDDSENVRGDSIVVWSAKMVTGVPRAEKFGDLEDHKVLSEGCESRHNHGHVVVVQDLATPWPTRKPEVIYTDNSLEFGKACEDLSWNHCTSTPHRSETNGTAERRVRGSKEGTSAVLLQSGLDESWWVDSMECYLYLRNKISCLMGRHLVRGGRVPFNGSVVPFGAIVEYHPISAKRLVATAAVRPKALPSIFLGCALHAGGIWKET